MPFEQDVPSNAVLLANLEAMKETMLASQVQNHEAHAAIVAQGKLDHGVINKSIEAVVIQTTATNGTVKKHDKTINMIIGGLVVSNAILIPAILILFQHYLNSK